MDSATRGLLQRVLASHPTPCFVLDFDAVVARTRSLESAFEGLFATSYAVKANPNPFLLEELGSVVRFIDVSSAGELERCLERGIAPGAISFTGPGKTDRELAVAVARGIDAVVLESPGEARRLDAIAARAGRRQRVLLRISPAKLGPGFGAQMAGRATAFGVDEEQLPRVIPELAALGHLELVGFHVYAGAQCLKVPALAGAYRVYCDVFRQAISLAGIRPERLVFGSGLGIPYHQNERPIDLDALARECLPDLRALHADFPEATLMLETGRFLVGEAGRYLTRVVDVKVSRGTTFCVCDGGMNHNLAAAGLFGMVIPKNYPFELVSRDAGDEPCIPQDIVGPLCTALDTIGRGVELPALAVGDVIAMGCTGAYGATASPVRFISHGPPSEVLVTRVGGELRMRAHVDP